MPFWTTSDLPEKDRFSYWREVLCEAYIALNPTAERRDVFAGEVKANRLGPINVTTIASRRQKIYRGRSEIARMPREVYFLNLQVRGQCRMCQGSREALINPGEFSIVDSTEPYLNDYCSDDWLQYSFRIPRELLRDKVDHPEGMTALRISRDCGPGAMAVDYLEFLVKHIDASTGSEDNLGKGLVDLVALAVGAGKTTREECQQSALEQLKNSLIAYIDKNVADPKISPSNAAAHYGVSTRYVHRALEEGGQSFGRLLLKKRLQCCASDLVATRSASISDIALRWGFNDFSHFSRVFRQQFGMTPRDYRQHGGCSADLYDDVMTTGL